ncbi:MAG: B12-binding domain-containing radical SAM protein [Thermoplasmata archaeon]|nr:B12-binding domain-containing radical SAM protein [Thermoplasmata archaeon]
MKATLVWPAFHPYVSGPGEAHIPHGIGHIATECIRRGHQIELIDGRVCSMRKALRIIRDTESEVIGFSVLSAFVGYTKELVSFTKKARPDLGIAVGGIHPTVCPRDLPECDWLVQGEGEITFWKILEGEEGRGVVKGVSPDLGELAPIDRNLFKIAEKPLAWVEEPTASVMIARGCPYKCTFCQPAERILFGSRLRFRPVDSVISELEKLNLRSFMVDDDCFTCSPSYVEEFCERIRPLGLKWLCQGRADNIVDNVDLIKTMRDAGLIGMLIGHESGDNEVLNSLEKGTTVEQNIESTMILKGLGIKVWSNIMVGLPGESSAAVMRTLDMVKKMEPDIVSTSVFTPYPGSELADKCVDLRKSSEEIYYMRGRIEPKIEGPDYKFIAKALRQMQTSRSARMSHWAKSAAIMRPPLKAIRWLSRYARLMQYGFK